MKKEKFWRCYIWIMVGLFVLLLILNITYQIADNITWSSYTKEWNEAKAAGYTKEFTVCNREQNIQVQDEEYIQFRAYRKAIIDGCYLEHILVQRDDVYFDKAVGQQDSLVLFGNLLGYLNEESTGQYYTIVDLYSICSYRQYNLNNVFWKLFGFTLIGGLVLCVMLVILAIHILINKIKYNRLK